MSSVQESKRKTTKADVAFNGQEMDPSWKIASIDANEKTEESEFFFFFLLTQFSVFWEKKREGRRSNLWKLKLNGNEMRRKCEFEFLVFKVKDQSRGSKR